MRLILINKPFQVLTRFKSEDGRATLADYVSAPGLHPAGRLDFDSEGLLLLTDHGPLQAQLSNPKWKVPKTYHVQVEGEVDASAIQQLQRGVMLNDGMTQPADAARTEQPAWLWARNPPIRYRKNVPDSWLSLTIKEGRNRQVRRMTAAVGFPTLRLIRWSVGPWNIADLKPGEWRDATSQELAAFTLRRR